jgi:Sulfotransferase domain
VSTVTKFILINSFPKSGNTWLRSILSHLLFDGSLARIPDRYHQSPHQGTPFTLPGGETIKLYKHHDSGLRQIDGAIEEEHLCVFYIVRHPLDVFVSQLNYMLLPLSSIADPSLRPSVSRYALKSAKPIDQLSHDEIDIYFKSFVLFGTLQPLFTTAGSWIEHAQYWHTQMSGPVPIIRLRYEDMLLDPFTALEPAINLLGCSRNDLEVALLRADESTARDGAFFWRRQANSHLDFLSSAQIKLFYDLYSQELMDLGYPAL